MHVPDENFLFFSVSLFFFLSLSFCQFPFALSGVLAFFFFLRVSDDRLRCHKIISLFYVLSSLYVLLDCTCVAMVYTHILITVKLFIVASSRPYVYPLLEYIITCEHQDKKILPRICRSVSPFSALECIIIYTHFSVKI